MRCVSLAGLLLVALQGIPLFAQEAKIKPVMVTAVAPVEKLLADVDYFSKVFDAEDTGKMIRQVAGPFLGGIDRKRPWGSYVTLQDGEEAAVAFVPVTSLQVELSILEEQLGKAEDLGDGLFKLVAPGELGPAGGQPLYVKEQTGWAFLSDKAENLASLPNDPVALLGGLDKKYDVATRFLLENVSAADRQKFIDTLKENWAQANALEETGDEKIPDEWMKSFETALQKYAAGARYVDVGLTVAPEQAKVSVSLAVVPMADSELAKSLAASQSLATSHAGILFSSAAVVVHRSGKLDPGEVKLWDEFIVQSLKEAETAPIPPERQALAKEGRPLLERLAKAAHADGNVEWGSSHLINKEGQVTLVGGLHVAGLKELETDVRAFLEKHQSDPELSKLTLDWDFAKHGNVRIIQGTPPADAPRNPLLVGDDPKFYVGIDADFVYFAAGADALPTLKEAIDRSAARPNVAAAPFRLRLDVRQLVKAALAQGVQEISPAFEKLNDKLAAAEGKASITANLLPHAGGLEGRLEIGEGVLRAAPEIGMLIWQSIIAASAKDAFGEDPGN